MFLNQVISYMNLTGRLFSSLQGVLGIKVKIMLDWDPKGKQGPMTPLPDVVTIHMPKEEEELAHKPHVGKEAEL
jgi:small subunit ribosomal protein S3e